MHYPYCSMTCAPCQFWSMALFKALKVHQGRGFWCQAEACFISLNLHSRLRGRYRMMIYSFRLTCGVQETVLGPKRVPRSLGVWGATSAELGSLYSSGFRVAMFLLALKGGHTLRPGPHVLQHPEQACLEYKTHLRTQTEAGSCEATVSGSGQ